MECLDRGWSEADKPQGAWTWGVLGSLVVHGLVVAALVMIYQGHRAPRRIVVPVETIALVPRPPGPAGGGGSPAKITRPAAPVAPKPAPPPVKPRKRRVKPKPRPKVRPAPPPRPELTKAPVIPTPAPAPAITRSPARPSPAATGRGHTSGGAAGIRGSGRGGRGGGRGTGSGPGAGSGAGRGVGTSSALQGYLHNIRVLLERQKNYPWMARRRRLQGVVTVRFTIAAGGQIKSSRISRSSGHNLLDQAARETVRKVGRFPPLPASLHRQKLTIEVPLAFRLRVN